MREIPQQAIELIKRFEGCKLSPYLDIAGISTIGYGHALQHHAPIPATITPEQAESLLIGDLQASAMAVLRNISRPLTDNQYSALLSFTFNLGGAALQRSTLRRKVNGGYDAEVPHEFIKWDRAGGKISRGLQRRRREEAELYSQA